MRFAEFGCLEAVQAELLAVDKQGVIHELVQALKNAGQLAEDDFKPIVNAILKREELGSTGIGWGAAIPHTKHSGVEQTVAAVGVSRTGVDFAILDGESVYILSSCSPPRMVKMIISERCSVRLANFAVTPSVVFLNRPQVLRKSGNCWTNRTTMSCDIAEGQDCSARRQCVWQFDSLDALEWNPRCISLRGDRD